MGLTVTLWPFRCQRCAYELAATPDVALCPECGATVAESRPETRPGIPWQRGPSLGSWCRTLVDVLVRPRTTYASLRIDRRALRPLLVGNLALAWLCAILPACISGVFGQHNVRIEFPTGGAFWSATILYDGLPSTLVFVSSLLIPLLVVVTFAAARWYAPRRSPPTAPDVVVANAAVASFAVVVSMAAPACLWLARYLFTPSTPMIGGSDVIVLWWNIAMAGPILAFLVGMVWTAILDTLGGRINRFANPFNEGSAPHGQFSSHDPQGT